MSINELKEQVASHPPTNECADAECLVCGIRDCPHGEPLHYHHDGCPSCYCAGGMRYFGAGEHHTYPKAAAPVGELCQWCDDAVAEGDSGFLVPHAGEDSFRQAPWHQECFLRSIVGSVGHQRRRCSCFGGQEEDPPGLTRREAAVAAARAFTFPGRT